VWVALKRGEVPSLVVNGFVEVKDSAVDLPVGWKKEVAAKSSEAE
jgi:hypothetical protein